MKDEPENWVLAMLDEDGDLHVLEYRGQDVTALFKRCKNKEGGGIYQLDHCPVNPAMRKATVVPVSCEAWMKGQEPGPYIWQGKKVPVQNVKRGGGVFRGQWCDAQWAQEELASQLHSSGGPPIAVAPLMMQFRQMTDSLLSDDMQDNLVVALAHGHTTIDALLVAKFLSWCRFTLVQAELVKLAAKGLITGARWDEETQGVDWIGLSGIAKERTESVEAENVRLRVERAEMCGDCTVEGSRRGAGQAPARTPMKRIGVIIEVYEREVKTKTVSAAFLEDRHLSWQMRLDEAVEFAERTIRKEA